MKIKVKEDEREIILVYGHCRASTYFEAESNLKSDAEYCELPD